MNKLHEILSNAFIWAKFSSKQKLELRNNKVKKYINFKPILCLLMQKAKALVKIVNVQQKLYIFLYAKTTLNRRARATICGKLNITFFFKS